MTKQLEEPKEAEHVDPELNPVVTSEGWNILQKVTFFVVIVGVVAIYFKMRTRETTLTEKFPA